MLKKIIVAAIGATALSAYAAYGDIVVKSVELKNGATVHIFQDGKMAMENRFGQVARMQEGAVMEAKDGQTIVMVGDEVARLNNVLRGEYRGGK